MALSVLLFGCSSTTIADNSRATTAAITYEQAPLNWVAVNNLIDSELPSTRWGISDSGHLNYLVGQALKHNHRLQAAASRMQQAIAEHQLVISNDDPDLRVRANTNSKQLDNDDKSSQQKFGLGVYASWEVDLWHKLSTEQQAAKHTVAAYQADYQAAQLSLEARVIGAWLDVIEQDNLLMLVNRNKTIQQRRLLMTERRLDLGLIDTLDLRNNNVNFAKLQANAYDIELKKATAQRKLQTLLGRYPALPRQSELSLPQLTSLAVLTTPQSVLLHRPDIIAAEQRLIAAGFRWQLAKKARLPNFTLAANWTTTQTDLTKIFQIEHWLGAITASLVAPILYLDEFNALVNKSKAMQNIALANYQHLILQAWQQVENALHSEDLLHRRQIALSQGLKNAQYAQYAELQTARQYEQGLVSSFELLASQRTTITTETDYVRVSVQRLRNRVNLLLALGLEQSSNKALN